MITAVITVVTVFLLLDLNRLPQHDFGRKEIVEQFLLVNSCINMNLDSLVWFYLKKKKKAQPETKEKTQSRMMVFFPP